jgi:hypothetical protein
MSIFSNFESNFFLFCFLFHKWLFFHMPINLLFAYFKKELDFIFFQRSLINYYRFGISLIQIKTNIHKINNVTMNWENLNKMK